MMSLLQNAFANTSSSLAQSKMMGNIVFILLTPISHQALFAAYISAACVRGLLVALGVVIASMFFVSVPINNIFLILFFGVCGGIILAALGSNCWYLGRKVRPYRSISEFCHFADDIFIWCFLFGRKLTARLANDFTHQSFLLFNRRVSCWVLR
jgi:hypothetical protein